MCEVREMRRSEALRGLEDPEGEIEGNKDKRVMGFGEYHHWAYERVLKEKPNYIAYVRMESERRRVPQTLFQERLQEKKGQWAYQRNLEEGEISTNYS